MVIWIIGQRLSLPKTGAQMIGCWKIADMVVCRVGKGQSELMGSIHCTRISLYPCYDQPIMSLTTIEPLLSRPTGRSEDPHWYQHCCIVPLS